MVDPLTFVLDLATDQAARDRFRADPDGVLDARVEGASDLTGEDVDAVAEVARRRVDRRIADRVVAAGTVRPRGAETPRDAAVRVLVGLCDVLDGPAVEPVALPHRAIPPDPPPPADIARGGGLPVPTSPPGGRWLHPVIPDRDEP